MYSTQGEDEWVSNLVRKAYMPSYKICVIYMSGWPSGLRRQTQVTSLAFVYTVTRILVLFRGRGFKSHF